MTPEERLNQLEDAHRALAAQFTALQLTFRAAMPLICQPTDELRAAINRAYETTSNVMDEHQQDADYQRRVLHWLDVFGGTLLGEGYKPYPPQNPDEPSDQPGQQ